MAYNFTQANKDIEGAVEWLKGEFRSIQTGRATPQVLDLVHVDIYGARTQIAHAGSVNIEDARTLRVSPWDKTIIGDMERAINDANLGLSVSSDDQGIRVHFPALTTETREKLVKVLKERLEDARVKVRLIREDVNKDIDARAKEGEYGEDERIRYRGDLQKIIDQTNGELEELFEKKEKEVLGE
ncbi:MAG: Frr, ribosome recycling factor [Candidatus Nomurabacteria bacterium]|nr:Frr, ribosome recycling factor [Candidatus Nomurabacteria bacterium]